MTKIIQGREEDRRPFLIPTHLPHIQIHKIQATIVLNKNTQPQAKQSNKRPLQVISDSSEDETRETWTTITLKDGTKKRFKLQKKQKHSSASSSTETSNTTSEGEAASQTTSSSTTGTTSTSSTPAQETIKKDSLKEFVDILISTASNLVKALQPLSASLGQSEDSSTTSSEKASTLGKKSAMGSTRSDIPGGTSTRSSRHDEL